MFGKTRFLGRQRHHRYSYLLFIRSLLVAHGVGLNESIDTSLVDQVRLNLPSNLLPAVAYCTPICKPWRLCSSGAIQTAMTIHPTVSLPSCEPDSQIKITKPLAEIETVLVRCGRNYVLPIFVSKHAALSSLLTLLTLALILPEGTTSSCQVMQLFCMEQ